MARRNAVTMGNSPDAPEAIYCTICHEEVSPYDVEEVEGKPYHYNCWDDMVNDQADRWGEPADSNNAE